MTEAELAATGCTPLLDPDADAVLLFERGSRIRQPAHAAVAGGARAEMEFVADQSRYGLASGIERVESVGGHQAPPPAQATDRAAAAEPAPPGRWGRPPGGERRRRFGGGLI